MKLSELMPTKAQLDLVQGVADDLRRTTPGPPPAWR